MDRWLAAWLQLLLVIPAAVSGYLVMKNQLRFSAGRTALQAAAVLVPCSLLGAWLSTALDLRNSGVVLLASLPLLFLLYCRTLRCGTAKCLAVFTGVAAMQTFPMQFARFYDAMLHPQMVEATLTAGAAAFQLGLSAALAAAFAWPEVHWLHRMVDRLNVDRVWYAATGISGLFFAANLLTVPRFYATVRVARIPFLFPVLEGAAFAVLAGIYLLFFYTTTLTLDNERLRQENRLLALQSRQYRILKAHLGRTARLRHDFRHSLRLLATLAERGDLEGLRSHLAQYALSLAEDPPSYCKNPALDALFAYYHAAADAAGIEADWQIDLPDPLPAGELDLAALFGNLMENAIEGCEGVGPGERYFSLTAEMQHGARLYIVSTNSFDGKVLMGEDGFDSTKHEGSGVGLASVDAIARKYGGFARAGGSGGEFCVDVLLRVKTDEEGA